MKIRNDLVTNSSSSSFIIAYKPMPEFDEETLNKYPFLSTYDKLLESIMFLEGEYETTRGEVITTKEDYDQYFVDIYGYRDETLESLITEDDYYKNEYEKVIKHLDKGFNILYKRVGYGDSLEVLFPKIAQNNENFIILEDE